ncbi:gas vesicle protein GvpK, partial [Methanocalculus sp.]|uniref:gas vesicle protein GvpK n=1 Tax=Methanocalculus sp. TaxID=2004547 RepID=UPI0027163378
MIELDEASLKDGLLSLVISLVEIISDALRLQAIDRLESGILTEEEAERLGTALMDLDCALNEIKEQHGIMESVASVRDGLVSVVV